MKINRFIFFLFIGVILSGVIAGAYLSGGEIRAVFGRIDQNLAPMTEGYVSASISKGTTLLLLAVGVIGALGVSRQKKDSGNDSYRTPGDRAGQRVNFNEDRKSS
jgi:hypothetical protein